MNIPFPEYGKNINETVDNLMDTVVKLRKELDYALHNLSVTNINDLVFPDEYTDEMALAAWAASGYATFITSNGIYTGTLGANDVVLANATSTATLNFDIAGSYYMTIKSVYTTAGNSMFIGNSTTLGGSISNMDRIDIFADDMYIYGDILAQQNVVIEADLTVYDDIYIAYSLSDFGQIYKTSTRLVIASVDDIEINAEGADIYVVGDIQPTSAYANNCGDSTNRWNYVYADKGSFLGNVSVGGQLYCIDAYDRVVSTRAVYINSGGEFGTTSSTERVKENINPFEFDFDALMQLGVKTFNFKPEYSSDQGRQYGVIAEEAQSLGLYDFLGYDFEGIPDYFYYERLPVALLQICQKLNERLNKLEANNG